MTAVHTSGQIAAGATPRLSRRDCLTLAAAGLAAPLLQACGGGSNGSAEPASVRWCREAIRSALARDDSQTTAVSIALFAGDRVVWHEAFGQADREKGVPATTEMRFNLGSVAKVMAALAVMILRDRGQLVLDQPLVALLPDFRMRSPAFTRITVRHLVSHASGFPGTNLRNVSNFIPIPGYAQDTQYALSQSHLKHEPGELAVYCNDGFTMVEPLVRQLTGLSFPDFVQREILGPLGMTQSGYVTSPLPEGSYVHPYEKGHSLRQEIPAMYATGALVATPSDMMTLARMFMNQGVHEGRRIVSAEAIRDMGVDQSVRALINLAPEARWGLGWDSVQQTALKAAGLLCWTKNGGTTFFDTEFFVLPEARLAMLISGNGFDYGSTALAEGLLLRVARERGLIPALPPTLDPSAPAAVTPAPDTGSLVGIYANAGAPFQVLAASDGSLTLNRWTETGWEKQRSKLSARSDGHWWSDESSTSCYRFMTVRGRRYLVQRLLRSNRLYWLDSPQGEWLPPLDTPLPAAWRARIGSQWELTNDSPESVLSRDGPTRWRIGELPERPGYVMLDNEQLLRVVSDDEAGMSVKISTTSGRDLYELNMVTTQGQETFYSGSLVFRRIGA